MRPEPASDQRPTRVLPPVPDPAAVLGSLPDPVIVVTPDGTLVWANHRAEVTFGYRLDDLRGSDATDLVHPDDLVTATASLASVQEKALGTAVDLRLRAADGTWVHVEGRGWSGLHDPHVQGIVVAFRRLDDRGLWTVTGGDARRQAAVLDHAPSMTLLLDSHGRLEGASRAFTATLGLALEDTLGTFLSDLVVASDRAEVRAAFEGLLLGDGSTAFEATFVAAPDREPVPFWLTAVDLLDDEEVQAVVVSGVEIAGLVAVRQELAHRATHDPLTGLANRALVRERLGEALAASVGTTARVGLVSCDLDGLAEITDVHGHATGDEVLLEVAARVRGALAEGDTAGRVGDDHLLVVAIRDSVVDVEATMDRIVRAVEAPITTTAGALHLTLSAGCAVARDGARADDMLRRAEQAKDHRKRAPRPGRA